MRFRVVNVTDKSGNTVGFEHIGDVVRVENRDMLGLHTMINGTSYIDGQLIFI